MAATAKSLSAPSLGTNNRMLSDIKDFILEQDLKLTSKITPNWSISWKDKNLSKTVGKIIHELAKTFVFITVIIPLITFTADYINTKKTKQLILEHEKLKKEEKNESWNKTKYVAFAALGITTICVTALYFISPDLSNLLSIKTAISTAEIVKPYFFSVLNNTLDTSKYLIRQYYPNAVGGIVATTAGWAWKLFVIDKMFYRN